MRRLQRSLRRRRGQPPTTPSGSPRSPAGLRFLRSPQDRLKPVVGKLHPGREPGSAAPRWRQRLGHLAVATPAVSVASMNGGH
jgi:hypothetical protein